MAKTKVPQWSARITDSIMDAAGRVMSGEALRTFLLMEPKDQLVGLACLAHMAGDTALRDTALRLLDITLDESGLTAS